MSSWVSATKPYKDGDYDIECEVCKSLLRVEVTKQDGHNEPEEYSCPVCGNTRTIRASNTPSVTVLRKGPAAPVQSDALDQDASDQGDK